MNEDGDKFLKLSEDALALHDTIMELMEHYKKNNPYTPDFEIIGENMVTLGSLILNQRHQSEKMKNPFTPETTNCLKVKIKGQHYDIPLENVFEVVPCDQEHDRNIVVHELEGCLVLGYCDHLIPLIHLEEYLDPIAGMPEDIGNIVIIKSKQYFYGLIVESVEKAEEGVVKKIDGVPEENGTCCVGAVLTEKDGISLVLDVDGIGSDCGIKQHIGDVQGGIHRDERMGECSEFLLFDLGTHQNYGIPMEDISSVESIPVGNIDCGSEGVGVSRKNGMPLVWVARTLGLGKGPTLEEHLHRCPSVPVLVVKRDATPIGLIVEKIRGIGETALAVDTGIGDRKGILGAVILGERVVSIVNVEFLLKFGTSNYQLRKSLEP